ncbi:hypothetical protein OSTOST_24940, partial [Ostertagia ostertagi]
MAKLKSSRTPCKCRPGGALAPLPEISSQPSKTSEMETRTTSGRGWSGSSELCRVTAEYAPVSIIGPNRKNGDRLIVVDQSDFEVPHQDQTVVVPIIQTRELYFPPTKLLRRWKRTRASSARYTMCFDLDGLKFDPSASLGIISGPFRVSWQLIGQHYREFINRFVVINTPSYINVLWSAISPFVPENARNRVAITGKEWRQEILELADCDCLPERYGGEIPDEKVL